MNNYLLLLFQGLVIFTPLDGRTVEEILESYGATETGVWAEFVYESFNEAAYLWPGAWSITGGSGGTAVFSLGQAKLDADREVQTQSLVTQQELLDGYTPEQIAAQAALPSVSRDVRFQTVINDLNVESAATLQKQVDIAAATTIAEVNAIVYP
jgi:hypothetical protein